MIRRENYQIFKIWQFLIGESDKILYAQIVGQAINQSHYDAIAERFQ